MPTYWHLWHSDHQSNVISTYLAIWKLVAFFSLSISIWDTCRCLNSTHWKCHVMYMFVLDVIRTFKTSTATIVMKFFQLTKLYYLPWILWTQTQRIISFVPVGVRGWTIGHSPETKNNPRRRPTPVMGSEVLTCTCRPVGRLWAPSNTVCWSRPECLDTPQAGPWSCRAAWLVSSLGPRWAAYWHYLAFPPLNSFVTTGTMRCIKSQRIVLALVQIELRLLGWCLSLLSNPW